MWHSQTQQVVWMFAAVCEKKFFTAVCMSSLTLSALASWPPTRYLVIVNRKKSCSDLLSLRCYKNNHTQSMTLLFICVGTAPNCSHVIYSVKKSSPRYKNQYNWLQRRRQGGISWALHFYSFLPIKCGWQPLAGMDCCASVRSPQWYCLLKLTNNHIFSVFVSTGLGATCFQETAWISHCYVYCAYLWRVGQVCAAAVPLMLAGWGWLCLFYSRQSDRHHYGPEGWFSRLLQAQVSFAFQQMLHQPLKKTLISLISLSIFSLLWL